MHIIRTESVLLLLLLLLVMMLKLVARNAVRASDQIACIHLCRCRRRRRHHPCRHDACLAFAGTIGVLVGSTYDVCLCVAANITSVASELIERVQSLCTRTTEVHMLTYIEYI